MTILTNYGLTKIVNAIATNTPVNIEGFIASDYTGTLDANWEIKDDLPGTHYINKEIAYISKPDPHTVEFVNIVQRSEASSQMGTVAIYDDYDKIVILSQPSTPIPPGMRQVLHIIIHYNNIADAITVNGSTLDITELYSAVIDNTSSIGNILDELHKLNLKQTIQGNKLKEVINRVQFVISSDKKYLYLYDELTGLPYRISIRGGTLQISPATGYTGDNIDDSIA